MKNYLEQLQKVTQSMIDSCEREDWKCFAEQEKERHILIETLSQGDLSNPDYIYLLKGILLANDRLINKANQLKEESGKSLLALKRQLKNSKHYNN